MYTLDPTIIPGQIAVILPSGRIYLAETFHIACLFADRATSATPSPLADENETTRHERVMDTARRLTGI